jgi:hypothetical protein
MLLTSVQVMNVDVFRPNVLCVLLNPVALEKMFCDAQKSGI